jgi:hypothetical protein
MTLSPLERARIAALRELVALIPPEASVVSTEFEGPHVSTRLVMYSLKWTFGDRPDYVLLGRVHEREGKHLAPALGSGEYGLEATRGGFFLLRRGASPEKNREVARRLAIPWTR